MTLYESMIPSHPALTSLMSPAPIPSPPPILGPTQAPIYSIRLLFPFGAGIRLILGLKVTVVVTTCLIVTVPSLLMLFRRVQSTSSMTSSSSSFPPSSPSAVPAFASGLGLLPSDFTNLTTFFAPGPSLLAVMGSRSIDVPEDERDVGSLSVPLDDDDDSDDVDEFALDNAEGIYPSRSLSRSRFA